MYPKRVVLLAATTATLLLGALVVPANASALAAAPAATAGHSAAQLPTPAAATARFVELINQLRTSRGLGPLAVDNELTTQANAWAATMSSAGRIFHTSDMAVGISADWTKLGENVGVGADIDQLFQAFVASATHYENLVDPAFTHLGVGVVVTADRIYTAHRFMAVAPPAPPVPRVQAPTPPAAAAPTPAPSTTAAPTTAPPTTASPTTTAAPSTTTTEPPATAKLGPVERIADLVDGRSND